MNFEKSVGIEVINTKTGEKAMVISYAATPSVRLSNGVGFAVGSPISKEWKEFIEIPIIPKKNASVLEISNPELSFDELFTELKDKKISRAIFNPASAMDSIKSNNYEPYVICAEDIVKHCISKSRVIKIIRRLIKKKEIPFTKLINGELKSNLWECSIQATCKIAQANILKELLNELEIDTK